MTSRAEQNGAEQNAVRFSRHGKEVNRIRLSGQPGDCHLLCALDKALPWGTNDFLGSEIVQTELASYYWGNITLQKLAKMYSCVF